MRLRLLQHRAAVVNPFIDHSEVVDFGECMFVNQMQTPLLRSGAFSLAVLNEAGVCSLTFGLELLPQGIVILIDVQSQEMGRWKILATAGASIRVVFRIVNLESVD